MATYTKYKSLEKPLSTERYNVAVANKNNDVIDSELHKLELKNQSQDSLLATKDALNSEISRATARENDIIQDLTAEISRAKSSENELSDHIQNEIDRAIQAETDIKEELDNYLPITGGTIVSNANPILELKRNGNWVAIDMVNSFGKLFKIEGSMESSDASPVFKINELIAGIDNQKTLFLISSEARRIYDKKTNRLKDILVDGEAVPMTDGVVTRDIVMKSNNFPAINIVREDFGQTAAIQLTNGTQEQKGMILEVSMVNSEGKDLRFHVRDRIANKELFRISLSERRIYDKESGTLKDILVKGEALPSSGGTLKSTTDFFPLRLERTTGATGCGLEFKGTAGAVGNIQMTYDTSSNNENELRCFVKDEDKKDHGVLYVSRDRKKVYSKEAGGLKNIMTDYEVPFRFGIDSSGDYGYYRNDTGEFVKIDVPEANNENASNSFFASVNQSGSYEMKFYFSNLLKDYKEETPSKNNSVLSAIMKIEVFSNGTLELYSDSGLWGTTGKKQYIDSYLYLCNSESEIYKNPSGYDRIRQRIILKEIGESLKTQYGTITSFSNSKNNGINGYTYEDFGLICSPASGYWFNVNIIPLSN